MCIAVEWKGGMAIVCGTRQRRSVCRFCSREFVSKLCDYPVAKNKTCDRGMCDRCSTSIGEDVDYCPNHKHEQPANAQGMLFA